LGAQLRINWGVEIKIEPSDSISGRHVLNGVYNDPKHGDYIFPIAIELILQTFAANGARNSRSARCQ